MAITLGVGTAGAVLLMVFMVAVAVVLTRRMKQQQKCQSTSRDMRTPSQSAATIRRVGAPQQINGNLVDLSALRVRQSPRVTETHIYNSVHLPDDFIAPVHGGSPQGTVPGEYESVILNDDVAGPGEHREGPRTLEEPLYMVVL